MTAENELEFVGNTGRSKKQNKKEENPYVLKDASDATSDIDSFIQRCHYSNTKSERQECLSECHEVRTPDFLRSSFSAASSAAKQIILETAHHKEEGSEFAESEKGYTVLKSGKRGLYKDHFKNSMPSNTEYCWIMTPIDFAKLEIAQTYPCFYQGAKNCHLLKFYLSGEWRHLRRFLKLILNI